MIKKLAAGNTFCVLPWIENFTNTRGQRRFCCWSTTLEDNQADLIREKIWAGQQVSQCTSCYKLEEKKVISPRQQESALWLKDPEIREYFNSTSCPTYKPVFFDIRLSNKCNLACIGCNPNDSSLWAKELELSDPVKTNNIDVDQILQSKKVYIAGGEPFLIDKCIDIINLISNNNPNIELVINTNLTSFPEETFNAIKKIKNTSIIVSLDSYGTVNEYHRYPMKWNKFLQNLDVLKDTGASISFNTVVDAVSVFGFDQIHLLEDYVDRWLLSILTWPTELSLNNLPENLKTLASSNLHSLQCIKFYKTDMRFKSKVDRSLELVNEKGNSAALSAYIQTLDQRRHINHTEFLGVNLIEK